MRSDLTPSFPLHPCMLFVAKTSPPRASFTQLSPNPPHAIAKDQSQRVLSTFPVLFTAAGSD